MKRLFFFLVAILSSGELYAYYPYSVRANTSFESRFFAIIVGSAIIYVLIYLFYFLLGKSINATTKLANVNKWKKSEQEIKKKEKKQTNRTIVKTADKKVYVSKTKQPERNMKPLLTVLIIYEIIAICILADSDGVCENLFSYEFCDYEGFQYIFMCLFVPAVIAVIYSWRSEIKRFWQKLSYVLSDEEQLDTKKTIKKQKRNQSYWKKDPWDDYL